MIGRRTAVDERLERLLVFLSVSGGAALLCKRSRRVLAAVGDVDTRCAIAALDVDITPPDVLVHTDGGVVAEVGLHHRLFVHVSPEVLDPRFAYRIRRARDIIERLALHARRDPPLAPPTAAPAHAVVFAVSRRRS